MPNFTTPIPPKLTGRAEDDVEMLKRWGTALVDELTYLFNNLDSGNVIEAASVKAENLDTTNARITNAQIGALTADKLAAGKVNTNLVTVEDGNGSLSISGSKISISDAERERFRAEYNKTSGEFIFELLNESGEETVSITSEGNAIFSGTVAGSKVNGSEIFASTIIGTDEPSYNQKTGGVFANIDETGIKIMQDQESVRKQKVGMSVAEDGTAYLVLGAGNGNGGNVINGVVYTNGAYIIEKNDDFASMGLSGYKPQVLFWESSEELWLAGEKVMINGINVLEKLEQLENRIGAIHGAE